MATAPIVDIEKIIHDYTWKKFKRKINIFERPLMKSKYEIEVYWGYLNIHHERPRFGNNANDISDPKSAVAPVVEPNDVKPLKLFQSTFTNNTAETQKYAFKIERQTTNSWNISITRGFTVGRNLSLELSLPWNLGKGVGTFSSTQTFTNAHGETKTDVMSWSVDSEVIVKKGEVTPASLQIDEVEFTTMFAVSSVLSLRKGDDGTYKLPIAVRRKSDKHIKSLITIHNLAAIFHEVDGIEGDPRNPDKCHEVYIQTVGVSRHNTAVGQKVIIGVDSDSKETL